MDRPHVSIVLVNYNGNEDTIECVKSLQKCDYLNYDIVVVDNASENFKELEENNIFNEPRTHLVRMEENTGFSGGNNIGIKFARRFFSQYYLLLNNDTIVEPNFLTKMIEDAESKANIGIVTGKILYYKNKDVVWFAGGDFNRSTGRVVHFECDCLNLIEKKKFECSFATGCLQLIRADVLDKIGYLSEDYFLYSEDVDYCCRVIDAGFKILYDSEVVIYHKVSASTGKNSRIKQYYMIRNEIVLVNRYCSSRGRAYFALMKKYFKLLLRGKMDVYALIKAILDSQKGNLGYVAKI